MEPDFVFRQKMASIASVVALVVLGTYTRCTQGEIDVSTESDQDVPVDFEEADVLSRVEDTAIDGSVEDSVSTTKIEYILLLGLDRTSGKVGRTDSIIVVALDRDSGHFGMFSIPRDLWVEIPGVGPGRINKVYRVGDRNGGRGVGLELLKQVVAQEFGIEISYSASVDFKGFVETVDLLGGIPVDVKCSIEDCFHVKGSDVPCKPLSLEAGLRHLDGRTALMFSRSRHGRTDLDRARRQQAVLLGFKQRITRVDVAIKLPQLFDAVSKHIVTDLDLKGALRWGLAGTNADRSKLHGLVLRPPVIEAVRTVDGKQVFVLNRVEFEKVREGLFRSPMPGVKSSPRCRPKNAAFHYRERLSERGARDQRRVSDSPGPGEFSKVVSGTL
jgi:LCP family protein required for cell wall assembly